MEIMVICLFGILLILVLILLIRIYLLKKAAAEIKQAFEERLKQDTNTLIDLSSHDFHMRQLAESINTQLKLLRKQKHHYAQGDRQLKQAVTNISHDLRTPLTAIFGYLNLLEPKVQSADEKRYLSIIRNRCEVMKQLTEELFTYTSGSSKTLNSAKIEAVNLTAVLETCISSYYAVLVKQNIKPIITMPEKPVMRMLDKQALMRIFENIINNAIKYSDGDLSITLNEAGEITFANHAAALDEVQTGKLFDRFYTVESGYQSSGLGLTIAKELTMQMHGSINADYKQGMLSIHIHFPDN